MARPRNPYVDRKGYGAAYKGFEHGVDAMDAAWRKKIEAVYEGPIPASEHQDDPIGLLDWFVVQILKEQNDA